MSASAWGESVAQQETTQRRFSASRMKSNILFSRTNELRQHTFLKLPAVTKQEYVASSANRVDGRKLDGTAGGKRAHLHVVAEEDSFEAELVAEKISDDASAEGRGAFGIQSSEHHVSAHQCGQIRGELCEWRQFHVAKSVFIVGNEWQLEMAVERCVPVSGEVLSASPDPRTKQASRERFCSSCHELWASIKRAITNHGIIGIAVDIEHRGKIEGETEKSQLHAEEVRRSFDQRPIAGFSQNAHRRKLQKRGSEATDSAPLLVEGDDGGGDLRRARNSLTQSVRRGSGGKVAAEEDGPGAMSSGQGRFEIRGQFG